MARFELNRRWVLVLATGVSLACCVGSFRAARADGMSGAFVGVIDPTDTQENPPSVGDPDLPSGSNGKQARLGRSSRQAIALEQRAVGDSRVSRDSWAWRISVLLQGYKRYYSVRF